jgi:hypothetical protein
MTRRTRRQRAAQRGLAALVFGVLVGAGALADAAWTSSDTGNAYAGATTEAAVSIGDASASTTPDLYPGATGTAYIKVTNPNPFPVTVVSVTGNGAITSDQGAACDASTGVSFTDQTGLSGTVGAGATTTLSLPGAVSMDNSSANACQGAVFTIPVTVGVSS